MIEKIAVFPGSFDPFTIGHEEIVRRGLRMFDRIIIAVGINVGKSGFMDADKRIAIVKKVFADNPQVSVESYTGLTVDYCKRVGAKFIIRGLRTAADFEYERSIGQINRALDADVETVFLLTSPQHTFISSTIVKDIIINGGDASKFLPSNISQEDLKC